MLSDCRFRRLPEPTSLEEEMAAEPWFHVGEMDVFPEEFRAFLVPPGPVREAFLEAHGDLLDVGFWQGAFRDPAEPGYAEMCEAVQVHRQLTVELLYGDHEGGQRMVSRFALGSGDGITWLASVGRHWNLDRPDPR